MTFPLSPRTTLVIWMVATTLLSPRTQWPRPGTALMTHESVRFQILQSKLLQHISCSTAVSPFLYLHKNARPKKMVFPENCKTSSENLVLKFCFVIKSLATYLHSLTFLSLSGILCNILQGKFVTNMGPSLLKKAAKKWCGTNRWGPLKHSDYVLCAYFKVHCLVMCIFIIDYLILRYIQQTYFPRILHGAKPK